MSSYFKCPVITISREYGAGGRSVARLLSQKTGLPWYDQDFVKETARDSGYSVDDINRKGEELGFGSRLADFFINNSHEYNSSCDKIWEVQKNEVIKLSDHPCIIVGRASNIILREAGINSFDVFLFADFEHRMKTIEALGENGEEDLKKFIEKRDSLRRAYYKNYTKKELGSCRDYNLCIDTGKIGVEKAVELIASVINQFKES